MDADGGNQVRLTAYTAEGYYGLSWSPDAARIAFVSARDGNFEIYAMNADGSDQTRLTNDPSIDLSPAWSPDGSTIAFTSTRSPSGVYVMGVDGSNQTRLGAGLAPNWSPDGTRIVFDRQQLDNCTDENQDSIWAMNRDGSSPTQLTPWGGPCGQSDGAGPWAPDGSKIAFGRGDPSFVTDGIWVMNPDGSNQVRLTSTHGDQSPDWQPRRFDHPHSATSMSEPLVPAFRQTISSTQCAARGGMGSTHGAPLSLPSCNPPGYLPNTQARLGPGSTGSSVVTAVPGSLAPGDQADLSVVVNATDIRSRATGGDYDPSPGGADVTISPVVRLTDTYNGTPTVRPGTTMDFGYPIAVDCAATADPTAGSVCSANTSFDAVTPGAVSEYRATVMTVSRHWLYDSGANGVRGDGDDRQFAQSGIYVR
jgi:dipeptidyl aminopeptidase/acylaminoacyl peptidase